MTGNKSISFLVEKLDERTDQALTSEFRDKASDCSKYYVLFKVQ